jgi:hypothetical protein
MLSDVHLACSFEPMQKSTSDILKSGAEATTADMRKILI